MTNIIINADDLGLNKVVNQNIENLIQKRCITSATMMANGEAVEEAIRIAKTYHNISFGIHLCLDEYRSITKSDILKKFGIVDKENSFTNNGIYKIKKPTKELKVAIYNELKEQIKIFHDAGLDISHIDSHHHFHTRRIWILKIINDLAIKYNINLIRRPVSNRIILWRQNNEFLKINHSSNSKLYKIGIITKTIVWVCARSVFNIFWIKKVKQDFKTTDKFFSYYTFYQNTNKLMPYIKNKTIELMCHPGHPNYVLETDLIMKRALDNSFEYNYISYNNLR